MQNHIYHGATAKSSEVIRFIQHVFATNQLAIQEGQKAEPICIWGRHGIGKTELIDSFAQQNGYQLAYLAPAQFEEMGDLIGMPQIVNGQTTFAPPQWVPTTPGPGILLIDDINRADDRILRGLMQLLQKYKLQSWALPKDWQIICTANPDGGDYSVTPLDDAIITRMRHITMVFDVTEWAQWAEQNNIDSHGINFVLSNPEHLQGQRTTPRTLVQFFKSIKNIPDLEKEKELVLLLAEGSLDAATTAAFIDFIDQGMYRLIGPEDVLQANDFKTEVYLPLKKVSHQKVLRVDFIATLCNRLVIHLPNTDTAPSKTAIENLRAFLQIDYIPKDIKLNLLRDLVALQHPPLNALMADPTIADLLLVN